MKIWCSKQMIDETGDTCCLSHLHEGRVLKCPYNDVEDRLRDKYPCADYAAEVIVHRFDTIAGPHFSADIGTGTDGVQAAYDFIISEIARVAQVPEKFLRGEGL